MTKRNLKREFRELYGASAKRIDEIDVPRLTYLMIDGEGDPNKSQAYTQAVEALFSVSYAAKFMLRKGHWALDYTVMPLEGLWWADDRPWRNSGWKNFRRAIVPKFCTLGLLPRKDQPSRNCTTTSMLDLSELASITRSI